MSNKRIEELWALAGKHPRYRPAAAVEALGYLVEEMGEVQAAVGKTLRWGPENYNPDIPPETRETNRKWILRELQDLKLAIELVEEMLK